MGDDRYMAYYNEFRLCRKVLFSRFRESALRDGFFTVIFLKRWGRNSWLVSFNGPYDQSRSPHVRLRFQHDSTMYDEMNSFSEYRLVNLHRNNDAIMWNLLLPNAVQERIPHVLHLTVHYGSRSMSEFRDHR